MKNTIDSKYQGMEFIKNVFRGFCMGTADIIPGISGGTIAFIFGIYEDFIYALKSFNLEFLLLIKQFKIKEACEMIPWKFLVSLFGGVILAILSLSKMISWLLVNKPIFIFAFFFGLILATIPIMARVIKRWRPSLMIGLILAALITYYVVSMVPTHTPEAWWFVFLSAAIAISAMILPGISGAFILVLLGKYQFILEAINQRDFLVIGIFLAGVMVGILSFVRILGWLFKKYHDGTMAVLTGIVIGSLNKIWPWKETLKSMITEKGKVIPLVQINHWPRAFDLETLFALILIVSGFLFALLINRLSPKKE